MMYDDCFRSTGKKGSNWQLCNTVTSYETRMFRRDFSDIRRCLNLNSAHSTWIESDKSGWQGHTRSPVTGGGQLALCFGSLVFTPDDVDNTVIEKVCAHGVHSYFKSQCFSAERKFPNWLLTLIWFGTDTIVYLDPVFSSRRWDFES